MKRIIIPLAFMLALNTFTASSQVLQNQNINGFQDRRDSITDINIFIQALKPYGQWINYQGYGDCWVPNVDAGFQPYVTGGRWVEADAGWTWYSDYAWGWAPFHYGSWKYDRVYGWIWKPGTKWAPAWVTWGDYNGLYGWAPVGFDFDFRLGLHNYRPPVRYWHFVSKDHIRDAHLERSLVHDHDGFDHFHGGFDKFDHHEREHGSISPGPRPYREPEVHAHRGRR